MEEIARGALSKMTARLESNAPVQYAFRLDDREVAVNPLIGRPLRLEYLGSIFCTHCGRKTKKSFSQGYCYPCFTGWRSATVASSARRSATTSRAPAANRSGASGSA